MANSRGYAIKASRRPQGFLAARRGAMVRGAARLREIAMWRDAFMLSTNNPESRPLLTNEQLASLGGGRVAYLKRIRSEDLSRFFPSAPAIQPGLQLFALLAADGTPIIVTDSRDAAVANAMSQELEMVSLH
jgi:hypothetical protein